MPKYIFKSIPDPENTFDITAVTFEVDTESRDDLIDQFISFLSACGFSVKNLGDDLGVE